MDRATLPASIQRALDEGAATYPVERLPVGWTWRHRLNHAGFVTLGDVVGAASDPHELGEETQTLVVDALTVLAITLEDEPDALGTPLDVLGLSTRAYNCLMTARIRTVEQLVARSRSQLGAARNLGETSLTEIERALAEFDLALAPETGAGRRPAEYLGIPHASDDESRRPAEVAPPKAPVVFNPRRDEMIAMRLAGMTLDEIGQRFGVTRERVRQMTAGAVSNRQALDARAARAMEEAQARSEDILRAFRRGDELSEIAESTGLLRSVVEHFVKETASDADKADRRRSRSSARAQNRYSDLDLVEAVRTVASQLGRTPSSNDYQKIAAELSLPSLPTVANRLGSWSAAVRAAGMEPHAPNRGTYTRKWTPETCWCALTVLTVELGSVPSVQQYELLAQGDDRLPSLATVRNRLGPWSGVVAQLARLPKPGDLVARLTSEGCDEADVPAAAWLAYLGDELSEEDLMVLIAAGNFEWDESFGEPPVTLRPYVELSSEDEGSPASNPSR